MTRILNLQALQAIGAERMGADLMRADSTSSWIRCNCSSQSFEACGPPPPEMFAL